MKCAYFYLVLCTYVLYVECKKWRQEYNEDRHESWQGSANAIKKRSHQAVPDPPDHTKLVPMARYVLHNSGMLNTHLFLESKYYNSLKYVQINQVLLLTAI